jgi:hypothetical protein
MGDTRITENSRLEMAAAATKMRITALKRALEFFVLALVLTGGMDDDLAAIAAQDRQSKVDRGKTRHDDDDDVEYLMLIHP